MGCGSSRSENNLTNSMKYKCDSKLTKDEEEYIYQDNDKKKAICITHDIFIQERNYSEFKHEYEIIKHLGSGAYGSVHQVRHVITSQIRAVKIIDKSDMEASELENLTREVEMLKSLNHPNIVKLYEYFTDNKNLYIVTECCSGGELFEKIYELGNFSEKLAAVVMKNILMAVAFCHNQGIVHRDLKPENILLELDKKTKDISSLKIIDFGTSRPFKKNQKLKDTLGTPYYIAPEVLKEKYDEKCDVWSCGVIMYILITGCPPFDGRNDVEILNNVEAGVVDYDIEQLRQTSASGKSLLKQMLTYSPNKRITAQKALESSWFKSVESQKSLKNEDMMKILKQLNEFRIDRKLQEAAIHFIVNQLISKEDVVELRKVFMKLDLNNDGKLSYSEIVEGYKNHFGSLQPELDGKIIFEKVDTDKSGFISYEEFICATVDFNNIVTEEKLEKAFTLFDKNGDGMISPAEIKEILGRGNLMDSDLLNSVINEVDLNGDGEISFDEFKRMMLRPLAEK